MVLCSRRDWLDILKLREKLILKRKTKKETRVNNGLLIPLEKPALAYFCKVLPAWVTPDILTLFGLLGSFMIFFGYWLTSVNTAFLWLANLGFVINWFGDSMDGTIARYRHIERPRYGYFVDHALDALSQVLVFVGLGLSVYIRLDMAMFALIGLLLLSVLVHSLNFVNGVFRITYMQFGPTELRALAVLLNLSYLVIGIPSFETPLGRMGIYDMVLGLIAAAELGIFIFQTIKWARILDAQDRRKRAEDEQADKSAARRTSEPAKTGAEVDQY